MKVILLVSDLEQWFHSASAQHIGIVLLILCCTIIGIIKVVKLEHMRMYPPGRGHSFSFQSEKLLTKKEACKLALEKDGATQAAYAREKRRWQENQVWHYEIEYYYHALLHPENQKQSLNS